MRRLFVGLRFAIDMKAIRPGLVADAAQARYAARDGGQFVPAGESAVPERRRHRQLIDVHEDVRLVLFRMIHHIPFPLALPAVCPACQRHQA